MNNNIIKSLRRTLLCTVAAARKTALRQSMAMGINSSSLQISVAEIPVPLLMMKRQVVLLPRLRPPTVSMCMMSQKQLMP